MTCKTVTCKTMTCKASLFILALAALASHEATAETGGRGHLHTLQHDARTRHFRVHLPPGQVPDNGWPVVLVFHGGGGDVDGIVRTTGMDRTADRRGFLAVYPAGTGRGEERFLTWNAGRCCGSAAASGVDDVGFVSRLLDILADRYPIDRRRVYATGHSNGAQMAYRLACDLADQIAAIAPNASQSVVEGCQPARPVPVLHFHGTEDACALYDGGECGGCFADFFRALGVPLPRNTWSCPPVKSAVAAWASQNRCADETAVTLERGAVRCETYQRCAAGADVTLCTVRGGGHTWPGGDYAPAVCQTRPDGALCRRWKEEVGQINRDVDANEVTWEFFRRFQLPESATPRPRQRSEP